MYLYFDKLIQPCISQNIPQILLRTQIISLDNLTNSNNYYVLCELPNHDNRNKLFDLQPDKKYYILSMTKNNMENSFIYLFDNSLALQNFCSSKGKIIHFRKKWTQYNINFGEWIYEKEKNKDITILDKIRALDIHDSFYMELNENYLDFDTDFCNNWYISVLRMT